MKLLKRLPIKYTGQLHEVKLINFSISPTELKPFLPPSIRPRLFNDQAIISVVDVQLRNMHADLLPWFTFQYRHIGFRLLVDDSAYTRDPDKGIFFLQSFTDKAWVALGGRLFTNYRLTHAEISAPKENSTRIKSGNHFLTYTTDNSQAALQPAWLREQIGRLDRAYAPEGDTMQYVQIQREKWPIEWVNCPEFETDFFTSARLLGAFRLNEVIDYQWLPPQKGAR